MGVATMRVPTIFTAVDRFSSVVSKMSATTSAFGKTAEAAAMRTSRRFNSAGTSMLYTGAAIATGLGYAVNEAVKFEKAMATVSTTIDNTTPEMMTKMSKEVLEMSKVVPKSISELTDGLYDVVSAGVEASGAMHVLKASGRLAVAGLGTTQEGVDVLTSSLNSFNMKAEESEKIANMVFKAVKYGKTTVSQLAESFGSSSALIKNSNVSLAEYLATTAVLTTTGMTASRAQTQIASATTALIKPSGEMAKIFKSLGVKDIPEFIKKNKGLVNTLRIVKDEAGKLGILTSKAFGRKEGYSAMLSLLGPLSAQYNKVMGDMTSGTDTLTESFEKQQATTAANFQRMKNNVTILAIKIGDQLLPRINGFIDRIIPMVDGISNWISKNEWLANTLLKITLGLLALGAIAKTFGALFYGVAKVIQLVSFVTKGASAAMSIYRGVMLTTALSGQGLTTVLWALVAPTLAWLGPILIIVAALGLLAVVINKTSKTTKAFAQNNATHLRIVSGEYESMESRIARSNARIVANMKQFKMDLESVKSTGKTIAELRATRGDRLAKASEMQMRTEAVSRISENTSTVRKRLVDPRVVTDSDAAFNDIMSQRSPKNLAGSRGTTASETTNSRGPKGELIINIKDPGDKVESVDDTKFGGIPVKVTRTGGNR